MAPLSDRHTTTIAILGASMAIVCIIAYRRRSARKAVTTAVSPDSCGSPPTTVGVPSAEAPSPKIDPEVKAQAAKHVKFGNMCARGGHTEKALKHYALALEINPQNASAHHNSASICQRLNRFDEAIVYYKAALALKPNLVEAASNLAVAELNAKRPADAVATCRWAIALQHEVYGTANLEASHHLNVALRLLGRRDEAIEATWRRIEELAAATDAKHASCAGWARPAPLKLLPGPAPLATQAASLTVVCVKWGTLYGADYVNRLSRGARRALGDGGVAAFICFTDDSAGLDADIEVRSLPAGQADWKGWWYKACLFAADAGLQGRVLYLDLDTVIVGSMQPLRHYAGAFATLSTVGFEAEEGNADGYNTSAMLWDAGEGGLGALHSALRGDVFQCLMRWDHWVEMVAPGAHLLQDAYPRLFVDYRLDCREHGPPAEAAVVCFPRNPKPHEVESEWIAKHWV